MSPVGTSAYNVTIGGDSLPSGAGDAPELLGFDYSIGGINAIMTIVSWQPIGRVRFKCVGAGVDDHESSWTSYGLVASSVPVTDLEEGEDYTLQYQIDPMPDYAGWDEGAWITVVAGLDPNLPTWTQPAKNDPLVGDWEPDA